MARDPVLSDVLFILPEADRKARKVRGAHGGGLDAGGTDHGRLHDICLELHQEVIHARAAVDSERAEADAGVAFHSPEQIVRLEGERLEGRADEVVFVDAAGQADYRAAGVGIPVRSAEAGEGRHDVAPGGVVYPGGEVLAVGRAVDELELVAEPLYSRARYIHGALKSVGDLVVKAPRDGGEQSVLR